MTMPTFEPVAFVTYKGFLLHASDPKVLEHSDPEPLFANHDLQLAYQTGFEAGKSAQVEQEPLYVIFDGSPGHQSPAFVEVENANGQSRSIGHWEQSGNYWKLGPIYAAPPAHAVPEWISVDARLPEVELGGEMHCFVAIRNKASGKVRAIDSYWCNKPSDPEWDETVDAPDWALQTVDDGYLNLVGWAEITHHPDYSGYYEPIDECYAEVIAWQQIVYPASPEPTK